MIKIFLGLNGFGFQVGAGFHMAAWVGQEFSLRLPGVGQWDAIKASSGGAWERHWMRWKELKGERGVVLPDDAVFAYR